MGPGIPLIGRAIFIACVVASLCASNMVLAQSASSDPDAPGVLRTWDNDETEPWYVILGRTKDRVLACAMLTKKYEDGKTQAVVGLDKRPTELSLYIADRNQQALSGDGITLMVDGVKVGVFTITTRVDDGAQHVIRAAISGRQVTRVLDLFSIGGTVKFATDQSSYEFPLRAHALEYMNICVKEAGDLAQTE